MFSNWCIFVFRFVVYNLNVSFRLEQQNIYFTFYFRKGKKVGFLKFLYKYLLEESAYNQKRFLLTRNFTFVEK